MSFRFPLAWIAAACAAPVGDSAIDSALDTGADPEPIPFDTLPCDSPEHWPLALASASHPFVVHHRPGERAVAETVRDLLNVSWEVEVNQLGFRAPLPDGGRCGDDEAFDVFVWNGIEVAWVDAIAENDETPWDDWITYLVVDPSGPYGGDLLGVTLAHELNHACQASDDWWDLPIAFEMTSVFVEDLVFDDDDDYVGVLADFQAHPDWSLDRDDGYATWYMYGSALYLHFLRDRYFAGSGGFAADLWHGMRNPSGDNEPDLEDAVDDLLAAAEGATFLDSVVEFARWRWYTGDRDDGAHFEEGASWPAAVEVAVAGLVSASAVPADEEIAPMALGSAYVDLVGGPIRVSLVDADPGVSWVVQAVPGASDDGDVLDLSGGSVVVDATLGRTVVATALPLPANADPDGRTDARFAATLRFEQP